MGEAVVKQLYLFLSLLLLGGLSGCATIVSGTNQKISIASTQKGANIKIERLTGSQAIPFWSGKTPAAVNFYRKHSYRITISQEGFESASFPVEYAGMNGWIWGNIIIGGLPGILVDAISGAGIILRPDKVNATLVQLPISELQ